MTMHIFIGCRKRTGKDTFSDFVCVELKKAGISHRQSGIIQPVRDLIPKLFPLTLEYDKDVKIPEYGHKSMRDLIIDIVTPVLNANPLAFCETLVNTSWKEDVVITSDLRRYEEAVYFKDSILPENRIIVQVNRDGTITTDNVFSEGTLDDYDGWNVVIDNNDSLTSLEMQAKDFVTQYIVPNMEMVTS